MKTMRQFEVLHTATGMVTRVNAAYYGPGPNGRGKGWYDGAAAKAGHRYPGNCSVHLVPPRQEIPLPFDEIPLVIRRPRW